MPVRQLTVLSGKGGTGKTTVTASFFSMADGAVAADCDVDAPNLHLLLDPRRLSDSPYSGGSIAHIDPEKCTRCGICEESCIFKAISDATVNPLLCEGCGVCELVCEEGAAKLEPEVTGHTYISETKFGTLVHALLLPGSEATGRLVTETKKVAFDIAEEEGLGLLLVDGSPGIGCPVIASVAGSDLVLAVTEPTRSGLWGLERIHGVAKHFDVPMAVCINKSDINPEIADEIRDYAREGGVDILGEIPFDEEVNSATQEGKVLTERGDGPAADAIRSLWSRTTETLSAVAARQER
jgi:MinD superfamily P-loop ATPase